MCNCTTCKRLSNEPAESAHRGPHKTREGALTGIRGAVGAVPTRPPRRALERAHTKIALDPAESSAIDDVPKMRRVWGLLGQAPRHMKLYEAR